MTSSYTQRMPRVGRRLPAAGPDKFLSRYLQTVTPTLEIFRGPRLVDG